MDGDILQLSKQNSNVERFFVEGDPAGRGGRDIKQKNSKIFARTKK